MNLPATANPPHLLNFELGTITFTRIASHIYDLSLSNHDRAAPRLCRVRNFHFLGRIEQKSDRLWAVTYIDCQTCMPEYFDNWQQATLFLAKLV